MSDRSVSGTSPTTPFSISSGCWCTPRTRSARTRARSNYSATKAYNLVLAEGLWAELRDSGVDVLVSCAGATRTPNYVASEPEDANVPVQEPEQVAAETLNGLGRKPTVFPARVLRFTHFAFRHLTGRRTSVRLMAYASNRTYKEQDSYSTGDRG